jgi:hypothetical protein
MLWVGPQAKASCMVSNWSPKAITEYILREKPCLEALKFKYRGQRLHNNEERIVDCPKFLETLEEITIIIPVLTRASREEVLGKSNSTWEN